MPQAFIDGGKDRIERCRTTVSDKALVTIQNVIITILYRPGLNVGYVRARFRLGKTEGSQLRLGTEIRQKLFLLFICSGDENRLNSQLVCSEGSIHAQTPVSNFFSDDSRCKGVDALPAKFKWYGQIHQAGLVCFFNHLPGNFLFFVVFGSNRDNLRRGKIPGTFLHLLLFFGQLERYHLDTPFGLLDRIALIFGILIPTSYQRPKKTALGSKIVSAFPVYQAPFWFPVC